MSEQNRIGTTSQRAPGIGSDVVTRLLGGPPLAVIARLIVLSILVGVVLSVIGLDPWNIYDSVRRLVLEIWDQGFEAVRSVWRYFVLGAVVVVPVWLLTRLLHASRR